MISAALSKRHSFLVRTAVVGSTLAGISAAQNLVPFSLIHWQFVLQRLYYLPIILAALVFGWRGGIIVAALSGLSYARSIVAASNTSPYDLLDVNLEVMVFCVMGVMTGILADREYRQKRALQETTKELSRVYRELQENFDRMKRTERLSAIGQLSAGLAHEIRNPLAGIEGSAAVLQREPESRERRREFLEIIQKECRRLNLLLTNFLDFAKPRPPQIKAAEIGVILDSVMGLAFHAAGSIPISLCKDVPAHLPWIECDPEQIKQVLLNLTINAIQAMSKGGEILLSAREESGRMLIRVKDQGCGLSAEDVDRIFDPFFTTKENGTGLGLSVAHQIVGQHGGILTVERNAERGTTFSIALPLKQGNGL